MEPEFPDDLWDSMPPMTYCQCAESWVQLDDTAAADFRVSLRLKCPVCGHWTGSVPPAEK